MRVSLISAERSFYEGEATAIVAPAYDGLVGILPRHAPFLTLLGAGTLTVSQGTQVSRFTVDGGFLQVSGEMVRVVAESAQPA
jgi:F-type H+-transporting ATPase subunit epsilon